MNVLLQSIIDLKPEFETKEGFVAREWIIQKKNERGFFKSFTNPWKSIQHIEDNEILYGFSEGLVFTKTEIIFVNFEIRNIHYAKYPKDVFSISYEVPKELMLFHNERNSEKVNIKLPLYYSNLGGLQQRQQEKYDLLEEDFYKVYCYYSVSEHNAIVSNNLGLDGRPDTRAVNSYHIKLSKNIHEVLSRIQEVCESSSISKDVVTFNTTEDVFTKTSSDELVSICSLLSDSLTWKYVDNEGIRVSDDSFLRFTNDEGGMFKVTYNGEGEDPSLLYILFGGASDGYGFEEITIPGNIAKMLIDYFKTGRREEIDRELESKSLELQQKQVSWISEFDKDGNGEVDIVEGDDFMKLFRKHQTVIQDFDKEYINHLVKVSNYLKDKKRNIQNIFDEIKGSKNQSQLDESVGLLKNQIHTYESLLFHSLNLILSIVEDDLITVNEIYEEFDKLKIFKSDHEKEVAQKLSEIGDGLNDLLHAVDSMERSIVSGLSQLTYVTQGGFSDLNHAVTRELQSIGQKLPLRRL